MVSGFSFFIQSLVPDEIVIDLIKNSILQYEKENQSWIIEGFPRTKVQALSLQKIGVLPDKFILLNTDAESALGKIKNSLVQSGTGFFGQELDNIVNQALQEYNLHIRGVKDAFSGFIYEYDTT